MLLADKICIIATPGAASQRGIGRATARLFALHGGRAIILDLDGDAAAAAASGARGATIVAMPATSPTRRRARPRSPRCAEFGRIDVLVNNAGITQPRKTMDIAARLRRGPRREPARHAANVPGRDPAHAAQEAARSSASRRCRRSAAAASSAVRTTRRPRPACSAWPGRWRANWAPTGSASTGSRPG